jgi:hypothetical protein
VGRGFDARHYELMKFEAGCGTGDALLLENIER